MLKWIGVQFFDSPATSMWKQVKKVKKNMCARFLDPKNSLGNKYLVASTSTSTYTWYLSTPQVQVQVQKPAERTPWWVGWTAVSTVLMPTFAVCVTSRWRGIDVAVEVEAGRWVVSTTWWTVVLLEHETLVDGHWHAGTRTNWSVGDSGSDVQSSM